MLAIKKLVRLKARNKDCPICRKRLSECKMVFKKISESGYVRGYDAQTLLAYFTSILNRDDVDDLKWPVCRELVTSVEIKRLERALRVPRSARVSLKKERFWKEIFVETLVAAIRESIAEMRSGVLNGNDEATLESVTDLTANLTGSLLYLYLLNKPKWRSLKNRELAGSSAATAFVFQEIKELAERMSGVFQNHYLELGWCGAQIIPIVRKLNLPRNLI